MHEKRVHYRVKVNVQVAFRSKRINSQLGQVLNLSRSGMFVETKAVPGQGDYVIASLDAQEFGKVVWSEGRVVRLTKSDKKNVKGMAVEFTRADFKGLDNLIEIYS